MQISLAQLSDLALQRLHAILLGGGHTGTLARVRLMLSHPAVQGLWGAAHLPSNGHERSPLRFMLSALLANQPDRSLTQLW